MEEQRIKEERERRFREMGIPMPLTPITNPQVPVKNQDMAKRLAEIRSGALKQEFSSFNEKAEGFKGIPVQQPKNPNAPQPAKVKKEVDPQAQALEDALYGNTTPAYNSRSYGATGGGDEFGTNFIMEAKRKLQEKALQGGGQPQMPQVPVLSEAELEKKIIAISSQVAKNVVKKVIMEYAKSGTGIIIEGGNIKKAELVDNNVVKIDGKLYRLSPVK